MTRKFLALAAIAAAVAVALIPAAARAGPMAEVALASRWIALAAIAGYAALRRSLTVAILLGVLAGAELGHDAPAAALHFQVFGQIFLRLIKTIVAPLLFGTLVGGIAGHADLKRVGRMGLRAIVFFEVATTLALFIGLAAVNLTHAGRGVSIPAGVEGAAPVAKPPQGVDLVLRAFPENIAKAVADGEILQVVVFSLLFGIGLARVSESKRRPVLAFVDGFAATMFEFTNVVMYFAPLGVGGAMAATVARSGLGMLGHLLTLVGTLYAALAVFLIAVLLPAAILARVPVRRFLAAVAEPASIAFATSSSEAALPRALEAMEAMGVPREVNAFVIPLGYSFNLTGTTLYLSLAAVFVAQAGGRTLTIGQELTMMLALMFASKGVAGVSRGAIVVLLGMAPALGLPTAPIFVLLGIDAVMDMGRTVVNVIGNCLAAAVIARWEEKGDLERREVTVQ